MCKDQFIKDDVISEVMLAHTNAHHRSLYVCGKVTWQNMAKIFLPNKVKNVSIVNYKIFSVHELKQTGSEQYKCWYRDNREN